jgi:hypothetical protein
MPGPGESSAHTNPEQLLCPPLTNKWEVINLLRLYCEYWILHQQETVTKRHRTSILLAGDHGHRQCGGGERPDRVSRDTGKRCSKSMLPSRWYIPSHNGITVSKLINLLTVTPQELHIQILKCL